MDMIPAVLAGSSSFSERKDVLDFWRIFPGYFTEGILLDVWTWKKHLTTILKDLHYVFFAGLKWWTVLDKWLSNKMFAPFWHKSDILTRWIKVNLCSLFEGCITENNFTYRRWCCEYQLTCNKLTEFYFQLPRLVPLPGNAPCDLGRCCVFD